MKKYVLIVAILLTSCEAKVPFNLGNGYYLDYDRNSFYTVFKENQYAISGQILKINYDSTFIIALIKPVNKIQKLINPDHNLNFQQQEKLINNSSLREYWILNKKMKPELMSNEWGYSMSNAFGPFNKTEYIRKRNELKVSNKLQLLTVREILENKLRNVSRR